MALQLAPVSPWSCVVLVRWVALVRLSLMDLRMMCGTVWSSSGVVVVKAWIRVMRTVLGSLGGGIGMGSEGGFEI